MTATLKRQAHHETAEDRERILHSIAERWHGDLSAYLEAISRLRAAAAHEPDAPASETAYHSVLAISRRR